MIYRTRPDALFGVARISVPVLALALVACQPPSGTGPVAGPRDEPKPVEQPAEDAVADERPEPGPVGPAASRVAGLRWVERSAEPALNEALRSDRASLIAAMDESLNWFEKPSSQDYFPMGGITHERARASVFAFRELLERIDDPVLLEEQIHYQFDFYESVGREGQGNVLFTGYYSPTFEASRTRGGPYQYPLYALPYDLVKDEETGETLGQRVGDRIEPYPTRAVIEGSGMLAGTELVWLRDQFEAYLVHIQGSAALSLADGSTMHISYAGTNGHEYVSISLLMVEDGKIREDELSLDEVRGHFARHPEDLTPYLRRNKRFVFFREANGADWPAGSLGVKVTALRSVATDKTMFPAGGVTLVVAHVPDGAGGFVRLSQFMLDQDTGGAIQTPGRADIYFGIGPDAERRAGGQYSEGGLYYLFLKEERFRAWRDKLPPLP